MLHSIKAMQACVMLELTELVNLLRLILGMKALQRMQKSMHQTLAMERRIWTGMELPRPQEGGL